MAKKISSNIAINFFNSTKSRISKKNIFDILNCIFDSLKNREKIQIGINIVGERKIRSLNKLYRNKDNATDVLSFAEIDVKCKYRELFEISQFQNLGEIFICWKEVERKAKKLFWTEKKMFIFLIVHGILHLLGYDHIKKKDAVEMQKMEKNIMMQIGQKI